MEAVDVDAEEVVVVEAIVFIFVPVVIVEALRVVDAAVTTEEVFTADKEIDVLVDVATVVCSFIVVVVALCSP